MQYSPLPYHHSNYSLMNKALVVTVDAEKLSS